MERDNLSFTVDDELGPAPRNHLRLLRLSIEKSAVRTKEAIDRVRVWPIHQDFGEEGELSLILSLSKLFDLCFSPRFLVPELVAGEAKDL